MTDDAMRWQEAVARVAGERTRAEHAAAIIKFHGGAQAMSRGALAYGAAKAEFDAVIGGLIAGLVAGEDPESLPGLEQRLVRAVELNDQLCARARELTVDAAGAREMTGAILGSGVVSGLIDAIRELFSRRSERDALVRKTIQQQLEEARWRSFADVPALA